MSTAKASILVAARSLFAERGYTSTTIKDIATAAGCSPALVMKVSGSKAQLYAASIRSAPPADEPTEAGSPVGVGYQLVAALVERRRTGSPEPWSMLAIHIHEAPDPASARAEIPARYVNRISERIGDTSPGLMRSQLVVSLLLGLATGIRTFELLGEDSLSSAELVRHYGCLVQGAIDIRA